MYSTSGRIVATVLAALVSPLVMICCSLATTLVAAVVLVILGHTSAIGLYVGAGLVGMAISWQFGCVYSWTAQKIDITGRLSSLFHCGCSAGGVVLVPLVNYLMDTLGDPNAMLWAILALVIFEVKYKSEPKD